MDKILFYPLYKKIHLIEFLLQEIHHYLLRSRMKSNLRMEIEILSTLNFTEFNWIP
jgi:hypothetical protein